MLIMLFVADGGSNQIANLQLLCVSCHIEGQEKIEFAGASKTRQVDKEEPYLSNKYYLRNKAK